MVKQVWRDVVEYSSDEALGSKSWGIDSMGDLVKSWKEERVRKQSINIKPSDMLSLPQKQSCLSNFRSFCFAKINLPRNPFLKDMAELQIYHDELKKFPD
ncbi:unnamed protein product [Lepeophtheirus salmonis]|uniref:(salmon louse) hypothetical protein n=1 Tax=Lepeophtheirus salmonis TaxID=72036 RepID=A0A7R8CW64_LEPSM|nr:unnamed protein product [Lepeophtheirus salmonis]CAF2950432.1 unnamed protein product [Lepeophtheirus salmonis]